MLLIFFNRQFWCRSINLRLRARRLMWVVILSYRLICRNYRSLVYDLNLFLKSLLSLLSCGHVLNRLIISVVRHLSWIWQVYAIYQLRLHSCHIIVWRFAASINISSSSSITDYLWRIRYFASWSLVTGRGIGQVLRRCWVIAVVAYILRHAMHFQLQCWTAMSFRL